MRLQDLTQEQLDGCIKTLEHLKANRQGGLLVTEQKTLDDMTFERDFRTKFDGYVEEAKMLITNDITRGDIPETVGSFSDLHDHVDANEYLLQAMPDIEVNIDTIENYFNRLSDTLDDWLKSGRI